jgi:hypothetical protein
MHVEQPPIYRKIIIPWYDSNAVCIGLMAAMLPVLFFGILGTSASLETPEYRQYGWLPGLLVGMSLWVIFSVGLRMTFRLLRQPD